MVRNAFIAPEGNGSLRRGFTLIEMAIVITILALIVSALLVGDEMVRAARFRAIVDEKEKFTTAFETFRAKYDCIPGDCPVATQFFGIAGGDGTVTDGDCIAGIGTSGTCNGDGDARIGNQTDWGNMSGGQGNEFFCMWQHLAKAELIEDMSYTCNGDGEADGHHPGVNVPGSKYAPDAEWSTVRVDSADLSAWNSTIMPHDTAGAYPLILGHATSHAGIWNPPAELMTGNEAFTFDNKFDDGYPFSGQIMVALDTTTWDSCTTSSSPDPADGYSSEQNHRGCLIVFVPGM